MAYNVLDLLDKAIYIAEKRKKLYNDALYKSTKNPTLSVLINVILKNIDRTIEYYKNLKLEVDTVTGEEIDFVIYDKISFLINEFNYKIFIPENLSVKTLLQSSLDIEKSVLALFIDIQGRLVKNEEDTKSNAYIILSKLILQKKQKIEEFETFIKNYSF